MEIQLVDLIIDALMDSLPEIHKPIFSNVKLLNVIDYIHENLAEITSIQQISRELNIPERSLRFYFQKGYGVSPKNYINNLRLHRVRKKLKGKQGKITDFAVDYNFTHMGQFTKDYKALFGELPSKTMNKKV